MVVGYSLSKPMDGLPVNDVGRSSFMGLIELGETKHSRDCM